MAEKIGCVCDGNWRLLVNEYYDRIGDTFTDRDGLELTFFGLVLSNGDFFYGFCYKSDYQLVLCSCVGDISDIQHCSKQPV